MLMRSPRNFGVFVRLSISRRTPPACPRRTAARRSGQARPCAARRAAPWRIRPRDRSCSAVCRSGSSSDWFPRTGCPSRTRSGSRLRFARRRRRTRCGRFGSIAGSPNGQVFTTSRCACRIRPCRSVSTAATTFARFPSRRSEAVVQMPCVSASSLFDSEANLLFHHRSASVVDNAHNEPVQPRRITGERQ
jgi:hypothetical protein